jgi:hypothetical protein
MKYLGLLSSTADGSIYQGHDLATSQTQLGLGVKERASELADPAQSRYFLVPTSSFLLRQA